MRTLIKNGTVVTSVDTFVADVLVDGERIEALAAPGSHGWASGADHVIDAAGRYVVPGGVDVHTHMELPLAGTVASDSFATGTEAAAWGGTTSIVDFAVQGKGESVQHGFDTWMAKADGQCAIDYGFHMIVGDVNPQSLKELDVVFAEGVTSFKLFMAYPGRVYSTDGEILLAMQRAAELGATVMMHAENGIAIDVLVQQALARGETDPIHHGRTRPPALEGEATHRAIVLASLAGCPLYIVHLSSREALEEVVRARDEGRAVFAETCPQYLYLSLELLDAGFEGAKFVCSPPLRGRDGGHREALWQGLRTGDLQVVATDHCPFCFAGQKELGRDDFTKIPNGLPGVEHRMDLLYQGAVVENRLGLNRWVEVCATAPARLFGMYPQKGSVSVGADADLVLYDARGRHTISANDHHMNVDYSCYEGMTVGGTVDLVMSRGRVIVDHGRYVGRRGHGRYIPRGPNEMVG